MTDKRNQPCSCGSGRRYKKCCGSVGENTVSVKIRMSSNDSNGIKLADDCFRQGEVALSQNRLKEAVDYFRQAIKFQPDNKRALHKLSYVYLANGKLVEAAASFSQLIKLKPVDIGAIFNLGLIFYDLGKLDDAIASFLEVVRLKPDYPEAYYNLGNFLMVQDKLDEAIVNFREAIKLKPNYAEAFYNIGLALNKKGKISEAISSFRQAIKIKPDYAEAYNNLGNILLDIGNINEGISSYRQALNIKPNHFRAFSNLLGCLNYLSEITQKQIYTESLKWNEEFVKSIQTDSHVYANNLITDRRLRIGYVSPDFRRHSVAFFIEPVLKAHNRKRVEIFCYANVNKPDEVTKRLQEEADHWFSVVGKEDEDVVARIKKDKIDILVDLAGHTENNCLSVFAHKPAPVQVTWLGYPNTTGLKTIDYRFTDNVADPEGEADNLHSEKLIRLKYGFLCYQPPDSTPQIAESPCKECGYITFGSFNNLIKVTREVIAVWAKILEAVPDSKLLLKANQLSNDYNRLRFMDMFAQEGIAKERLEMHSWMSKQEDHLGLYNRVDIGLDPFPHNGTTTTCEALWMGVPVVTMLGDRHAGRVGASILQKVGLRELVATSVNNYIELACLLTLDRNRLKKLRLSLRDKMLKSELMDSDRFTNHLEDVYQKMWQKHIENLQ